MVDTAEVDTVDFVGTSDQEEARLQLLEEDDAFASEATSQEDENGTGSDVGSELGNTGRFSSDSQRSLGIVSVVPFGVVNGSGALFVDRSVLFTFGAEFGNLVLALFGLCGGAA